MSGATDTHPPSPSRLPILIGITGKRRFDPGQSRNAVTEERVLARLSAIFGRLDRAFPHTPKVLLTGAAFGADTLAARAALALPAWSVALILPFEAALFEKDFRPADPASAAEAAQCAARLSTLRGLFAQAQASPGERRVMCKVMPPLRDAGGALAGPQQLDKDSSQADRVLRHNHYEQVGQFIAETVLLLIAVVAGAETAEAAQADGGTGRIIACRRAGRPDAIGADVARRSSVLRRHWDALHAPPAGYVWLIDAAEPMPRRHDGVTVLPPLAQDPLQYVYAQCLARPHGTVAESLETIRALYQFQETRAPAAAPAGREEARGLVTPIGNPVAHLAELRRLIRPVQARARQQTDRAFALVAAGFFAAVLALELYGELWPYQPAWLGAYIAILGCVALVVWQARRSRCQPRSEDYRAVSEVLRIQRAWWAAGVDDRADRCHLQGADAELARVRDVGRAIIGWVWLRTAAPPQPQPDVVRCGGPAGPHAPRETEAIAAAARPPRDWVGEQIWYLRHASRDRRRRLVRFDAATWFLFAMSAWLSGLLLLWLIRPGLRPLAGIAAAWPGSPAAGCLAWPAAALAILSLRIWLSRFRLGWLLPLAASLAAACCAGLAIVAAAPQGSVREVGMLIFVLLTAAAGASQFLNDKLGHAAEAVAYHEALAHFERAERELAAATDPHTGAPRDLRAYNDIIRDLGILALRENEVWLKAHRERPLSAVV